MRLKSIKLAGFKSFVDPTTVKLPSNLCAVVGPNGCGKSNIIDAVRWVMGESSAKNLRGENMTDVIFNGSSNRKPVGQASVELVFDNSDKTIKGEYAAYNEISVKRLVNTDAQSTYFLNGQKCRRRDITDIFLGTGLGPRSYSIIEQGMVSRLIESKPEELRIFIEEAAGISKYKERRRETENRIRRTKENLERLTDIREELERQLMHLQRQAKAAEKYKEYKQEERDTQARLHALQWQQLDNEVSKGQQSIAELEIKLEAAIAGYRAHEAEIETQRSNSAEANGHYQEVQAAYYSLGGEISKIEQSIEYQQQRQRQLNEELTRVDQSLANAKREMEEDLAKIATLEETIAELEPELEARKEQEMSSSADLEQAEESMAQWQAQWDQFNVDAAESTRKAEMEQQRINHLENIVERGGDRKQNLAAELESLGQTAGDEDLSELTASIAGLKQQQTDFAEQNSTVSSRIDGFRTQIKNFTDTLNEKRSQQQTLLGRKSSLEALQQAALEKQQGDAGEWIEAQGLASNSKLVDDLRVEERWQRAMETALGDYLQAICVDGIDKFASAFGQFEKGDLKLFEDDGTAVSVSNTTLQDKALALKITSSHKLGTLLQGIYCAESIEEAMGLRSSLQSGESIITVDGIWLGRNWLRVSRGFDEKAGVLKRQQNLDNLATEIPALEEQVNTLDDSLQQAQRDLAEQEARKEEIQVDSNDVNRQLTELSSQYSAIEVKIEQAAQRRQRLQAEISELDKQIATEQDNIAQSRTRLQQALDTMELDTEKREALLESRDQVRTELDRCRQQARADKDHTHQLALRHQTQLTQLNSLRNTLDRITAQVESYQERYSQVQQEIKTADDPVPQLKEELESKLSSRVEIETRLNEAKMKLDEIEHELRELENRRNEAQENAQGIRDALSEKRLSIEGATVKRQSLEQQVIDAGYNLQTVLNQLAQLEQVPSMADCQEMLERLGNRIQRLGPINLAAIDEYSTQSERKVYLDAQNEDLEKALSTLESAIKKIDRETRARFKETFDKINHGLQELFPKIFGGGHAYLDMIGDDLLDTGVAIMARPPGKRNSTIHLLSGGEKAMTAIALVFSIFHLNPSPFCMLDEVDAPLDDANVGRYANLVKEMSDVVQFIFITHNRLTMESASQLLGVTMHEPGVSRMVAVDIEEAAEMAAM